MDRSSGEARLHLPTMAALVGTGDDEAGVGPDAQHAVEDLGEEVQTLDRMNPPEKGDEGRSLRHPQPSADLRSGRGSDGRRLHSVRQRDHGSAGRPRSNGPRLRPRGGVEEGRIEQAPALDQSVRDALAPATLGDGALVEHAARRDHERHSGAARVPRRGPPRHAPEAMHVDEIASRDGVIESGAETAGPESPRGEAARQVAHGHSLVDIALERRARQLGWPVGRGGQHLDLDALAEEGATEPEHAPGRPAIAEGGREVGRDVEDSHGAGPQRPSRRRPARRGRVEREPPECQSRTRSSTRVRPPR